MPNWVPACARRFTFRLYKVLLIFCIFLCKVPVHFGFQLNLIYEKNILWHFRFRIIFSVSKEKILFKCIVIKIIWLKMSDRICLKVHIRTLRWNLMYTNEESYFCWFLCLSNSKGVILLLCICNSNYLVWRLCTDSVS